MGGKAVHTTAAKGTACARGSLDRAIMGTAVLCSSTHTAYTLCLHRSACRMLKLAYSIRTSASLFSSSAAIVLVVGIDAAADRASLFWVHTNFKSCKIEIVPL
jgi:hypothetical protein